MGIPVPSLSDRGWVTAPSEKIDLLLSHFFESDSIQSYLYAGHVSNLQGLIAQHSTDPNGLVASLRTTLENYLGRYYSVATVQISLNDDPTINPTNELTLSLYCAVVDDGVEYSVGQELSLINSKFQRIASLINTGTAT